MKIFYKASRWFSLGLLFAMFIQNLILGQSYRRVFPYYYDIKKLDINSIFMPNNNYGFLTVSNDYYPSVQWLRFDVGIIVYEQGLFFIGKINEKIYLSEAMWGTFYSPGPIFNNKPAMEEYPADSAKYRVYKITKGDSVQTNLDLKEWPKHYGAPISGNGKVKLYGDQMLWSVYNGFDSNCVVPIMRNRSNYPPFPIEVHQNTFAYKSGTDTPVEFLDDVVFLEYTIINNGIDQIDSAYVGLWTDIDFYGENNYPAIDTTLQLGYCWSDFTSNHPVYTDSFKIPAVGYIQLFGPSIPTTGNVATFKGRNRNNYKNINLTSFWGFHDDSYPDSSQLGPAYSRATAWSIARGLDKSGKNIIDPSTGNRTSFRYAGDTITKSGWLASVQKSHGGAGFYLFSGPFNLAPQDTQWVMYALIAAKGADNMQSIIELRRRAGELKKLDYSQLVKITEIAVTDITNNVSPFTFRLEQNYPNPFNPTTVINYSVPRQSIVKLIIYDALGREVATLVNEEKQPGRYEVEFQTAVGNPQLASGIYFYQLRAGSFIQTKKMVLLR